MESTSSETPASYVTLVSGDGYQHVIERKFAIVSPVIRSMLERSEMHEAITGICTFPDISSLVLEVVIKYMFYYYRVVNGQNVNPPDIPIPLCLEILVTADYLALDTSVMRNESETL